MKNSVNRFLFCCLSSMGLFTSPTNAQPAPTTDYFNLTPKEKEIEYGDLRSKHNVYAYRKDELDLADSNFHYFFTYKDDKTPLKETKDFVTLDALSKFTEIITQTPGDIYNSATCHAAIAFHYGMLADKMVLLYQPIVLKEEGKNDYGIIPIKNAQQQEIYFMAEIDGSLKEATANAADIIAAYQKTESELYIYHPWRRTEENHKFISGKDFRYADTRSSYLPIKQIDSMYHDNKFGKVANGNDKIAFTLVASDYYKTGFLHLGHTKNYKLHVVADFNIQPAGSGKGFEGNGVDFAQMCPPRCPIEGLSNPLQKGRQKLHKK